MPTDVMAKGWRCRGGTHRPAVNETVGLDGIQAEGLRVGGSAEGFDHR